MTQVSTRSEFRVGVIVNGAAYTGDFISPSSFNAVGVLIHHRVFPKTQFSGSYRYLLFAVSASPLAKHKPFKIVFLKYSSYRLRIIAGFAVSEALEDTPSVASLNGHVPGLSNIFSVSLSIWHETIICLVRPL